MSLHHNKHISLQLPMMTYIYANQSPSRMLGGSNASINGPIDAKPASGSCGG